ncbi:MAG: hypothetical protein KAS32_10945 [Candidatus Peribacteraceae bacterium]|nr:hypothetical protein [Candidatus Peribacteraceae bacterium]
MKKLLYFIVLLSVLYAGTVYSIGNSPISHRVANQKLNTDSDVIFNTVTVTSYERHIQLPVGAASLGPTAPSQVTYNSVIRCLEFDNDAEASFVTIEIPDDWVGGEDMILEVDWLPNDSAMVNGNTVKWDLQLRSVAENEDSDGTLTAATATHTDVGGATTQGTIIHTAITLDYNDVNNPLVKQDHVYIEVTRDMTGDSYGDGACISSWEWIYDSNTFTQI